MLDLEEREGGMVDLMIIKINRRHRLVRCLVLQRDCNIEYGHIQDNTISQPSIMVRKDTREVCLVRHQFLVPRFLRVTSASNACLPVAMLIMNQTLTRSRLQKPRD